MVYTPSNNLALFQGISRPSWFGQKVAFYLRVLRSAFVSKLWGDHIEYGYMCFSCFVPWRVYHSPVVGWPSGASGWLPGRRFTATRMECLQAVVARTKSRQAPWTICDRAVCHCTGSFDRFMGNSVHACAPFSWQKEQPRWRPYCHRYLGYGCYSSRMELASYFVAALCLFCRCLRNCREWVPLRKWTLWPSIIRNGPCSTLIFSHTWWV
jgi:hypothetical protein